MEEESRNNQAQQTHSELAPGAKNPPRTIWHETSEPVYNTMFLPTRQPGFSRDGKTEGFPLLLPCFVAQPSTELAIDWINTIIRTQNMPANTSTTLLSLPDELLDRILAAVKWDAFEPLFGLDALDFDQNLTQNTRDIQAVRLTCRRLAWRASTLLLPVVSVAISDPSSVDCLEQIARHAALAPYVRAVRVRFDVYDSALADDIHAFAAYLRAVWLGSDLLWEAKWARTFGHWRAFSLGADVAGDEWELGTDGVRDEWYRSIEELERQHAEYQRRFQAQDRLRPVVLGRIAAAMAAMPRATRLVLDDGPDTPHRARDAAFGAGAPWLVAPMNWANTLTRGDHAPPIRMLLSLPAVVHQAGVSLTALRIHRIRIPAEFPQWPSPDCDWDALPLAGSRDALPLALTAACASLRLLDFTTDCEPDTSGGAAQLWWPGLFTASGPRVRWDDVFGAMLRASRQLAEVRVDLQMARAGTLYETAMPVSPRMWPLIRVLHLRDGPLEVARLGRFLTATAGTLAQLSLDGMRLFARPVAWPDEPTPYSWSSVLDQLREHCREHGAMAWVRAPRGAEFDDWSVRETRHRLLALFAPDGDGFSDVDRYVGALAERNPIVEAGLTPLLYSR